MKYLFYQNNTQGETSSRKSGSKGIVPNNLKMKA
jgi:hypothetical protein